MLLTDEIVDNAMSINGGWNLKQMNALGLPQWQRGWRKKLVGHDFSEESINEFLLLKDSHLNPRKLKKSQFTFEPITTNIKFQDQYKHPNWQRFRLNILKRDDFRCKNCGSRSKTLHAHHLKYIKNKFVWEVPIWYVVTLCEDCHSEEHSRDLRIK